MSNYHKSNPTILTIDDLAKLANYSLIETLNCDPDAKENGADHAPRQVFSGHYVPVKPTPIQSPEYVAHSKSLFHELGFADDIAQLADFVRMFSGDISHVPDPLRKVGWACGYALSIFGTEYDQQCPFQTGNGYGDGRAISSASVPMMTCRLFEPILTTPIAPIAFSVASSTRLMSSSVRRNRVMHESILVRLACPPSAFKY